MTAAPALGVVSLRLPDLDDDAVDAGVCNEHLLPVAGHCESGPLLNGATVVLFGSTPSHPTPARCWEIIAKYKVGVTP
jgi:acetyl-CoA synthetase